MRPLGLAGVMLLGLGWLFACATPGGDPGGNDSVMPAYDPRHVCHEPDNVDCIASQRGYQHLVAQIWPQIADPARRQCVSVNVWNDYIRLYQCLTRVD